MAFYYFDASAIVKYFHNEPGTVWVRRIVELRDDARTPRVNQVYGADISLAEVPAALAILERAKRVSLSLRDSMYDQFLERIGVAFQLLAVTTNLAYAAGGLTQTHPLKGYAAVQLAAALDFNRTLKEQNLSLIFVSGDDTLLQAAQVEGLAIENPFDHE